MHGLEYPPGERIIIRPVANDKKQTQEKLFPFEGKTDRVMFDLLSVSLSLNKQFSGSSKDQFCSVTLPAVVPLAKSDAPCAQRCFIVCVPKVNWPQCTLTLNDFSKKKMLSSLQALPSKMLSNIFCRFGDLLDVYMLQNKNCGYAKYASEESAMNAIKVLNGAEICGVKLKVMEAEEPRDAKRKRYDDNIDS